MSNCITLHFASRLAAPAATVWAHATSPAGINRELMPLMRMTFPQSVSALTEDTVTPGQPICISWFLLFGFLPIDRARITLAELGPDRRFVEQSPLTMMKLWRHTRSVADAGDGSLLEDTLEFEARWPVPPQIVKTLIGRIFAHRHRRLRQLFG